MGTLEFIYAQQGAVSDTLINPLPDVTSLGQIFAMIINLITGIGWAVVIVMLALGFFMYVTSQGDKTKVETAQKWLTYAIIGGVGLFLIAALRTIIPSLLSEEGTTPGGDIVDFGE